MPPAGIHAGDSVAAQAQTDLTTAYNTFQGLPSQVDLTGQNLGGLTLGPAVYSFATSAQLTGVLTLDGGGNPNAEFVFQIGSTLTSASNSSILTINGASPYNVYWVVGSSSTLGTNSAFEGNIVALASITLNTGASLTGRALARNGAVTLDNNIVTAFPPCSTILLTPATLANGTVGVPYNVTIAGSGGTAPYTFDVTAGTLPAGLGLSGAGLLSGTPTAAGSSPFTVRATDVNACVGTLPYTMAVTVGVPALPHTLSLLLTLALVAYGSLRLRKSSAISSS